jgi:uncharacterized protein (DUF305 family)
VHVAPASAALGEHRGSGRASRAIAPQDMATTRRRMMMDPHTPAHESGQSHYRRLLLMLALSFAAMYVLMYGMVNTFANVYMNVNQVYMAGLMAAPMALIELALMGAMYRDTKLNVIVGAGSVVALALCWVLLRQQAAVSDQQFLRSMIPHHAGAILMCEQAALRDGEIQALCANIVRGQQAEIDLMKAKLRALDK